MTPITVSLILIKEDDAAERRVTERDWGKINAAYCKIWSLLKGIYLQNQESKERSVTRVRRREWLLLLLYYQKAFATWRKTMLLTGRALDKCLHHTCALIRHILPNFSSADTSILSNILLRCQRTSTRHGFLSFKANLTRPVSELIQDPNELNC